MVVESIETSTGTNIFACSLFRPPVRPNSLTDTIASNRQKMPYANLLTHSLLYPQSRDAIASKNVS